ncbi:MAG: histidinol-phosphatase HisJ family protein [Bacillota bacterium]
MIDLHIHSKFSSDSKQPVEEIIQESIKKNIKVISITDHIDYDYTDPSINFDFDIDKYMKVIKEMQKKYGKDIKILKGVELGLQPHLCERLNEFSKTYDFDFLIGSFHTCNKKDLYQGDFYKDKDKYQAWDEYLIDIYETVKCFDKFSVLGHLDILKRYNKDVRDIEIDYIKPKLIKIFKLIIKKGIGLEVNTSGLRNAYGIGKTLPSFDVLEIYYNQGGKLLTIGSDSHNFKTIGQFNKKVLKKLDKIGFEKIYYFEKQKPKSFEIKKLLRKF